MTTTATARANEIEIALQELFERGDVIEIRALNCGRDKTTRGFYDDFRAAANDAAKLDDRKVAAGIYVTLNRLDPAHKSLCANRLEPHAEKTTADSGIIRRRYLPIDFDPERLSGISATDDEMQAALDRARLIARSLGSRGWPEPILASSGNGAHLLYDVDEPNDETTARLFKRVLEAIATELAAAASMSIAPCLTLVGFFAYTARRRAKVTTATFVRIGARGSNRCRRRASSCPGICCASSHPRRRRSPGQTVNARLAPLTLTCF